jgi:hypothetical protein
MAERIAARPWLTVYRLPPYAHEVNRGRAGVVALEAIAGKADQALSPSCHAGEDRLKRMPYCPALLASFLASTNLELRPFL